MLTAAEGEPEGDHGGAAVEEDEGLQEGRGHLRKLSDLRDDRGGEETPKPIVPCTLIFVML